MEERNKKIITILGILAIIFTIIGGTLAIWMWQTSTTQRTQVTFTVGQGFSCSADGGGDITQNDLRLVPTEVNNTTTGNYIKRTITTDIEITETGKVVYMDLWLDIKTLGTELSNTEYFMYALTDMESTDPENDNIVLGNFKGKVANQDKITLLEASTVTDGQYLLWIWLDDLESNNNTMNQTFRLELGGSCTDQAPVPTTTALTLIANANPTTLTYANATAAQKANMWTFNQAATTQVPATTDYRFIGNSPNNYILFNGDEDWRIIGVFDNKIKIIKSTKIANTDYSFDYKLTGVGSSTSDNGSNDWTDSQLMYMLNTPFYKNGNTYNTSLMTQELLTTTMGDDTIRVYSLDGNFIKDNKETPNIIYELGKIPAETEASATSYSGTATAWELNETAKSQVAKTTFYLGGSPSYSQSATSWYNLERGITTPQSNKNPRSWTGYVGLMYPSDYAYTYAYGVDDTCFNNTGSYSTCPTSTGEKSWLWNDIIKNISEPWTISPDSSYATGAFIVVSSHAYVGYRNMRRTYGVHPSIYLKSEIELSGTGSSDDPYRIIE